MRVCGKRRIGVMYGVNLFICVHHVREAERRCGANLKPEMAENAI